MFELFKKRKDFDFICDSKIKELVNSKEVVGYHVFYEKEHIIDWTKANYSYFGERTNKEIHKNEINQRTAIFNYTGNVHININQHLRGIRTDKSLFILERINNITKAMEENRLIENVLAFRTDDYSGIKYKMNSKDKLKKGCYLIEKAFLSTTLLPGNRINWLEDTRENERVLMIIKVPKGTKCISACNISSSKEEYELLINKNCQLEVEKILYKKGKNIIMLCKVINS